MTSLILIKIDLNYSHFYFLSKVVENSKQKSKNMSRFDGYITLLKFLNFCYVNTDNSEWKLTSKDINFLEFSINPMYNSLKFSVIKEREIFEDDMIFPMELENYNFISYSQESIELSRKYIPNYYILFLIDNKKSIINYKNFKKDENKIWKYWYECSRMDDELFLESFVYHVSKFNEIPSYDKNSSYYHKTIGLLRDLFIKSDKFFEKHNFFPYFPVSFHKKFKILMKKNGFPDGNLPRNIINKWSDFIYIDFIIDYMYIQTEIYNRTHLYQSEYEEEHKKIGNHTFMGYLEYLVKNVKKINIHLRNYVEQNYISIEKINALRNLTKQNYLFEV